MDFKLAGPTGAAAGPFELKSPVNPPADWQKRGVEANDAIVNVAASKGIRTKISLILTAPAGP